MLKENQDKFIKAKEAQKLAKDNYRKSIDARRGDYKALVASRAARTAEIGQINK